MFDYIDFSKLPLSYHELVTIPGICAVAPHLLWPLISKFVNRPGRKDDEGKERFKLTYLTMPWHRITFFAYCYLVAPYGLYLGFTQVKKASILWIIFMYYFSGFGISGGAHRLWAHRAYKAKWFFRLLMMLGNTTAHQLDIYSWVRDHRAHHKFIDTDADPYNSKRGFFFSHIGWILTKKHPKVYEKGLLIDMSDLKEDPLVMFQKRFYIPMALFFGYILSTWVPIYFWNEQFHCAWYFVTIFRYWLVTNLTFCVNSVAHSVGMKPYDKNISAKENYLLAAIVGGEGFHNYHHVFPWDYKTSELGDYGPNFATANIDFFAKLGLAYDLKTVPDKLVRQRILRTGDGSHICSHGAKFNVTENEKVEYVYGWSDPDIKEEDKKFVQIINKLD